MPEEISIPLFQCLWNELYRKIVANDRGSFFFDKCGAKEKAGLPAHRKPAFSRLGSPGITRVPKACFHKAAINVMILSLNPGNPSCPKSGNTSSLLEEAILL